MSKIKEYSKFKDSNQEWLGNLPAHWEVRKTKNLFNLIALPAPIGNTMQLLSVYTALGVKPRSELEERGNKASTTDGYWIVKKGDIVVNKLLAWMGAVGISEYDGVTSPAYDLLRAKKAVNSYFYNYLFRNPLANREFKRHSRGIMDMRLRLYFSRFGDIKLPYPPINEQIKICHFLDYKLEKIARFRKKKKELIELLNEQKSSIINKAVTKGINSIAPMKNSNIEWLGKIPADWTVKKVKESFQFSVGFTPDTSKPSYFFPEDYIWANISDLKSKYISSSAQGISKSYIELSKKEIIPKGSLLYSFKLSVGKVSITTEKLYTNEAIFAIYPDSKIDVNYFYYSLPKQIIHNANENIYGAKILNQKLIKNAHILIPPLAEQKKIVNYLDNELSIINQVISTIEKEIELVEEYKTTLIAESVTGKIDVRDFVVPEGGEPNVLGIAD